MHGTHQDRLVKKLRRKQIISHQAANVYLWREYLPEHNRRFARTAARPEDYHPAGTASCGTGSDVPAGERADHRERLGSTLRESLFSAGACEPPLCPCAEQGAGLRRAARRHLHRVSRSCPWLQANCGAAEATAKGGVGAQVPVAIAKRKWVPPANHPWHEPARRTVQQKELRRVARASKETEMSQVEPNANRRS
jgi:hypothetical protein